MIDRESQFLSSFPYRSRQTAFLFYSCSEPDTTLVSVRMTGSVTRDSLNLARTDQVIKNAPALNRSAYIRVLAHQFCFPISCARACTVASEVFTEAQSFADCKLHIRTRLLAPAFSNFWKTPPFLFSFFFSYSR
jgi:hypothetical protein